MIIYVIQTVHFLHLSNGHNLWTRVIAFMAKHHGMVKIFGCYAEPLNH